jgi:hypothetical protein
MKLAGNNENVCQRRDYKQDLLAVKLAAIN